MIHGFRELNTETRIAFSKKLEKDIKNLNDGDYIYAFLPSIFSFTEKHDYTKIKIMKDTDTNTFIGFLCYHKNNDEMVTKISPKNIFSNMLDRNNNLSLVIGYSLDKSEAEAVKLLSIKRDLDEYCFTLGYDGVSEFYGVLNDFKLHNPEKFV